MCYSQNESSSSTTFSRVIQSRSCLCLWRAARWALKRDDVSSGGAILRRELLHMHYGVTIVTSFFNSNQLSLKARSTAAFWRAAALKGKKKVFIMSMTMNIFVQRKCSFITDFNNVSSRFLKQFFFFEKCYFITYSFNMVVSFIDEIRWIPINS